ncbi:MAG: hypothetical protein DME35_02055, partial [Verrucomicrobia bacterium]
MSKRVIDSVMSILSRTSNRGKHFKNGSRWCAKFAGFWRTAVLRKWRRRFCKRWPAARPLRHLVLTTKRSGLICICGSRRSFI